MSSELPLAGPSAGRLDEWGSTTALTAFALLLVLGALAIATDWPSIVNAVAAPVLVALLFAGVALRFLGLAKFRLEARAGYSTLQDLPALELRDATTGHLIRAANEPVAEWSRVSWLRGARRFDRYKLSRPTNTNN